MTYAQMLKELFPEVSLSWEDLLLLESFQVNYLPDRVAVKEFATLLRTHPVLHRCLIAKNPSIRMFLSRIVEENSPVEDVRLIESHCQEALWEIGDLIIYNKYPERYDALAPSHWEISDIHAITSLDGKTVADVGAGSGRIAFLVAPYADIVFAVEPIASFRSFMKKKAEKSEMNNLFVLDGTLDSIPLPPDSLDILITSNAIGWNLDEELREVERVVRPDGQAIHLLQSTEEVGNPFHERLIASPWNYTCLADRDSEKMKFRYYKEIS